MKKIVAIVLSLVLVLGVLTACGKKTETPSTEPQPTTPTTPATPTEPTPPAEPAAPTDLDLNAVYEQIIAAATKDTTDTLILFPESNPDLLEGFYPGLKDIAAKQLVLYMHPVTGAPSEILLVEAENTADVSKIVDIVKARVDSASKDTGYPENAKVWGERASIQSAGNYVGMVCFFEPFVIPEDIFNLPALPAAPAEPAEPEAAADLDLTALYEQIVEEAKKTGTDSLVLFPESNPDLLEAFYPGLGSIALKQKVLYMHPVTGAPSEILLVEVENAADVSKVVDIVQARVDSASKDTGYPENAKVWGERASVQSSGNYVGMVCFFEPFAIPENIFAGK